MKYLMLVAVFISLFCIPGCIWDNCRDNCKRLGYPTCSIVEYFPQTATKRFDCYCVTSDNHMQEVESIYDERLLQPTPEAPN